MKKHYLILVLAFSVCFHKQISLKKVNPIKDDLFNLITEAGYSLSVKSSDWRYNTCHLMCYIEIEHHKMFFRFGIGGKHYDTRGAAHKNYLKPIGSLGFGIRI